MGRVSGEVSGSQFLGTSGPTRDWPGAAVRRFVSTKVEWSNTRLLALRPCRSFGPWWREDRPAPSCTQPGPLRRPHDCDRGLRARLRAKVAAAPSQDRYVMSQISSEHRGFAVPMRWRPAGGDLSRPIHAYQLADHSLIRSTRRPRYPLHLSRRPCAYPCRSPGAGIAPTITPPARKSNPHSARGTAGA
jgi:hypothetical protein